VSIATAHTSAAREHFLNALTARRFEPSPVVEPRDAVGGVLHPP